MILFKILILLFSMTFPMASFAEDIMEMVKILTKISGLNVDMLDTQKTIADLNRDLNKNLTSHSGMGTYNYVDHQSYGANSEKWSDTLALSRNNGGRGALGQQMKSISKEYPIQTDVINQTVSDTSTRKYYAAQAQTVLAARAASQLDYDKIQTQIIYQNKLREQIEKTTDIKAAMDLANRIQVEGNLIQLELLREAALTNQQQALTTQGELNDAVLNANFLKK